MRPLWNRHVLAVAAVLLGCGTLARGADECLECHGLKGLAVTGRPLWLQAEGQAASTHGKLTCTDCHKGAEVYPHGENRVRCDLPCHVPGTTHEAIARAEDHGVHAGLGAPPCVGCHSSATSPKGAKAEALCLGCHVNLERGRRLYPDTPGAFGYWAHRRVPGGKRAPTCGDCHGVHAVQPASQARNACKTSGCHPGAGERFSQLFDHRGNSASPPWGGAGPLAGALLAAATAALALHVRRS